MAADNCEIEVEGYILNGSIGKGLASIVYKATDKKTKALVAIKKTDLSKGDTLGYSCMNEINLLKMVDSKNVIQCIKSFTKDEAFYLVLEYFDGGDLQHQIEVMSRRGTTFSERTIWYYFHQICNGLRDLHKRRILHRDLRPANVFLSTRGRVKLGDLGCSTHFPVDREVASTFIGSEYYMAPERISYSSYSYKSDIWSMGCMLYQLCCLRSPFFLFNDKTLSFRENIKRCKYIPIPSGHLFSKQLHFFIERCLSINPKERPNAELIAAAARAMFHKFEDLLSAHNMRKARDLKLKQG